MFSKLTLRPVMGTDNFLRGDQDYLYEVDGLPVGERALVGERASSHRWEILRNKDGAKGEWTGDYKSAEDALAALQKEFEK
jgi:hypothetical protein